MTCDADEVVQTSVSAAVTARKEKAETIQPSGQQSMLSLCQRVFNNSAYNTNAHLK